MAILDQLGINHTLFYQLAIFVFTFPLLAIFVFKPYSDLVEQREKKTKGGEEAAVDIKKKTSDLTANYEAKARKVSSDIKTIFDDYREQANVEYQQLVSKAREESQKIIEATRARVSVDIQEATRKMTSEVPAIASAIKQKMLSR